MTKNEIKQFLDLIYSDFPLKITISKELERYLDGNSKHEDIDKFESILKRIKRQVAFKIELASQSFLYPQYVFSDYDDDILLRYDKTVENLESSEKVFKAIKMADRIKEAVKSISWREFEILCPYILNANSIKNLTVTQSSRDQGIDFYGIVSFENIRIQSRIFQDMKLRIVGQARHSKEGGLVGHEKVSSFGTELLKLRKGVGQSYFSNLTDEFLLSPYPILGIFITNSYYSSKAINFANEYGMIFWNEEQISQDIATSEFIDKAIDSDGNIQFKELLS